MKNGLLIFLAGAVAGGIASGLYTKKKYEKELKDEQESVKETLSEVTDKEYADLEEEKEETNEAPKQYSSNTPVGTPLDIEPKRTEDDYHDYTSHYDGGEAMSYESEANSKLAPKMIKASEYGTDPMFEPQTLLYYTDNDVLTTETDEIIGEGEKDLDEIRGTIGDALTKFGFKDNDEDRIFVRNFSRNADYEIIKVFGAFEE